MDLSREHLLDGVWLGHQFPNLDGVDELGRFLPFSSGQSLGGLHNVVSGVLGWAGENLTLMVLEHAAVCLADDSLLDIGRRAGLCKERDFEKHTASEVDAL